MLVCLLLVAVATALSGAAVHSVKQTGSTSACPDKPADLVFLLDGSGSQGNDNFKKQLVFINKFVADFDIAPDAMRVGVVQFATNVKEEIPLSHSPSTQPQFQHAVSAITWLNGETNTGAGLHFVRTNVLTHARHHVDKLVIVLTDGVSLKPNVTVAEAAQLKKQATVAAIGVGSDVDRKELEAIASDRRHVFTVANFDSLDSIHAQLTDTTCTLCDSGPMDIGFLLDASGSEGVNNFHLQQNFTKELLSQFTIGPNATRAEVKVFATGVRTYTRFSDTYTLSDLLHKMDTLQYMNGETNTHLGINSFLSAFTDKNARYGSRRILVIVTDGRALEHDLAVQAAHQLQRRGVEMMVVGIGPHLDNAELLQLASSKSFVFRTGSFKNLPSVETGLLEKICNSRAVLTTTPPPTTPTTPTTTVMTTTPKPECPDKQADIVFLLDSSDSEGPENFEKQKQFVQSFVRRFVVGPNNVRFASFTFSDKVRQDFNLTEHLSAGEVAKAIGGVHYMGSSTNTGAALGAADRLLSHNHRSKAESIIIVITDGRSDDPTDTLHRATHLKRHATVVSIGVGYGVDKSELASMASEKSYVFTVENFDALHTIQSQFLTTTCGVDGRHHHG